MTSKDKASNVPDDIMAGTKNRVGKVIDNEQMAGERTPQERDRDKQQGENDPKK